MIKNQSFKMKIGGWGHQSIFFSLQNYPGIGSYLKKKFEIEASYDFKKIAKEITKRSLPPQTILPEKLLQALKKQQIDYSTSADDLLTFGLGKSYPELLEIFEDALSLLPDTILFPKTLEDLSFLFTWAQEFDVALIPFSGGSSVVGGLLAKKGHHLFSATVVLTHFNKILDFSIESRTVTVESCVMGPSLETFLNEKGFTFGHFPQSFEFSSVGGWIVTLSSGQNSFYYGGIEKRVESIEVVSPSGIYQSFSAPRKAAGPMLSPLFFGSEGKFGIITKATLKIAPLMPYKHYEALAFSSLGQGLLALQELAHSFKNLFMLRLSDEDETMAHLEMNKKEKSDSFSFQNMMENLVKIIAKQQLGHKGIDSSSFCLLMVGIEGQYVEELKRYIHQVKNFLKNRGYHFLSFGKSSGDKWLQNRFNLPYFREQLMANGLLVDTLETSCSWTKAQQVAKGLKATLQKALLEDDQSSCPQILLHFSHCYDGGVSLYFTILAKQNKQQGKDSAFLQWKKMKESANFYLKNNLLPASHHHGIGIDHLSALSHPSWDQKMALVRSLKKALDPHDLLNPEKTF